MKKVLGIVALIAAVFLFGAVGALDLGADDVFTWIKFWASGILLGVSVLALWIIEVHEERQESEDE